MLRKFLHITDLHLGVGAAVGSDARESEVRRRFRALVAHMARVHDDAVFCLCLGDIAHRGDAEAYAFFKHEVSRLPFPCFVLAGNHDERASFAQAFPDSFERGFVQAAIEDEAGVFLLLDTVARDTDGNFETHVEGGFCEARLAWLREKLLLYEGRDVFVAMHHPPCALDEWECEGLDGAEAFARLLKQHGRVRYIFCGHYHRPLSGMWRGMGLSCMYSSTAHQTVLPKVGWGERACYEYCDEHLSYGVLLTDEQRVLLHHVPYEEQRALGYAEGVIESRDPIG